VSRGTGRWTRVSIGLQVALAVGLAAACAGTLTWLAARPGLWLRVDLTADGRQTVDAALARLIDGLPRSTTAEVFFRPLDPPYTQAGAEAQRRMVELLKVARNQFPGKLVVIERDLSDVGAAGARMRELGLDEPNAVVLHDGEHQVVLRLLHDLARIDPGSPALGVAPRLESFRGDQALGNALLELGLDRAPVVCFSAGQGERELAGTELLELGGLRAALLADGFEVETWNAAETPELPADCDVVAVIAPEQPFRPEALDALRAFAARGGRLLVVPGQRDRAGGGPGAAGGIGELLSDYGIEVEPGFVAQPLINSLGQPTYGDPRCATLTIGRAGMDRRHPVTESLWSLERHAVLSSSRAFRRGAVPENGVLLDVLRSSPAAWLDVPDPEGRLDWYPNPRVEPAGSFAVLLAGSFQAAQPPEQSELDPLSVEEQHVTRILALGSADALGNGPSDGAGPIDVNRDLALNAFNWLAAREHRLVVRPREHVARRLDLAGGAQKAMNRVALGLLPGLALSAGLVLWWRRRR
jgi:hypothetical protein